MKLCLVIAVALLACHPTPVTRGPALATIEPAAQPVLDAWAKAVGGRDALARWQVAHSTAKITRGDLSGTFELWTTARGERRDQMTLGASLHETHVFDGERGWLVDRNNFVRALAGVELDDALALAFLDTNAALLPERRGGRVTLNPDGTLTLEPAGGHRAVTVELDAVTHLPKKLTRRDGEKLHVVEMSGWRKVDGVQVPFALREEDGDPHDTVVVTVTAMDHAAAPGPFVRPPDGAPDFALPAGKTSAEIPIELALGSLIMTKVTVQGVPQSFIIDSGAEGTVLNSSRLGKLGLTGEGQFGVGAGGGDTVASYVAHVSFELANGVTLKDQTVAAINFDLLEALFGRPIDGILGYDFLSRFVVEIDYGHDVLRVYDRATYKHDGAAGIPITLEGSTPWVDAQIDVPNKPALTGHFTVDTGCGCEVSLTKPFTDANHILEAVPATVQNTGAGAGGVTKEVTGELPAIHLGAITIEKPTTDFGRDEVGATADPESAGLIGALIFRKFRLVLDYGGGRMWLDPA